MTNVEIECIPNNKVKFSAVKIFDYFEWEDCLLIKIPKMFDANSNKAFNAVMTNNDGRSYIEENTMVALVHSVHISYNKG